MSLGCGRVGATVDPVTEPDDADAPSQGLSGIHALGLVVAGGTVGTAAREGLVLALPPIDAFPLAIFVINVTGAFLLGLLVERLARPRVARTRASTLQLLLGTGGLGGFTTYSALATDAVLLQLAPPYTGLVYAAATLLLGGLATFAGMWVGSAGSRRIEAAR